MKYLVDLTLFLKVLILEILKAGSMTIRDVDEAKEEPFLYASGWRGPGYIRMKGLVSIRSLFNRLVYLLALKIVAEVPNVGFVIGNVTGGVTTGYLLSRMLSTLLGRNIPLCWVKGTRADGSEHYPFAFTDVEKVERASMLLLKRVMSSDRALDIDFVAGLSPSGIPAGYRLAELLSAIRGYDIPFVYVREKRKKGGHKEMITGIKQNPLVKGTGLAIGHVGNLETSSFVSSVLEEEGYKAINVLDLLSPGDAEYLSKTEMHAGDTSLILPGAKGLVTEELVNFSKTTTKSVLYFRKLGFVVEDACTMLYYGNKNADKVIKENAFNMHALFTLSDMLDVAKTNKTHAIKLIGKYREFLKDTIKWNKDRGYEQVKTGGTQ